MGQQNSATTIQPISLGRSFIQWLGAAFLLIAFMVGVWAIYTNQTVVIAVVSFGLTVLGIVISLWKKLFSQLWQTRETGYLVIGIPLVVFLIGLNVYQHNFESTQASYVPLSNFLSDVHGDHPTWSDKLQINNSTDHWTPGPNCVFWSDGYYASTNNNGPIACQSKSGYGNFALQVQVKILQNKRVKGEEAGLEFRLAGSVPSAFTYYIFYIRTSGSCGLAVNIPGKVYHTLIQEQEIRNCYVKPGPNVSNQLAVIAIGNTINLYVNGYHLGDRYPSFTDTTYYPCMGQQILRQKCPMPPILQQGQIGLYVGDGRNSTEETSAMFSNLEMWDYYNQAMLSQ